MTSGADASAAGSDDDDDDGATDGVDDGTSSDPGGPEPPPAGGSGTCLEQCQSDSDCTIGGQPGPSCVDGRCGGIAAACVTDEECVIVFSGWAEGAPCTSGVDCNRQPAAFCLEVGGSGHCVPGVSPEFDWCPLLGGDPVPETDIDGAAVTVCALTTAICGTDAVCRLGCETNDDCTDAYTPSCNPSTGRCECTDYACEVLGGAYASCNAVSHKCGCSSDAECSDAGLGETCNGDGSCACSSAATCTRPAEFDGTSIVCAPQ
jgi:hypothetical protein